jgi:hypothetical protein
MPLFLVANTLFPVAYILFPVVNTQFPGVQARNYKTIQQILYRMNRLCVNATLGQLFFSLKLTGRLAIVSYAFFKLET